MHKIKKTKLGLMVALALSSSAVNAEWTADSQDHKLIDSTASIAHVVTRNDGGHYVTYTREGSGMDVFIRALDVKGNILWDQESLVFDREMSFAYDYGLTALDNGSARMAIRNSTGGDWNEEKGDYDPYIDDIYLFEIGLDGVSRWPEGIQVNTDENTIAMGTPQVYAYGNQSIVTWDQSFDDFDDDMYDNGNTEARVALFNEAGEQVWVTAQTSGEFASISDTYVAHDGVVVVYLLADPEALKGGHGHLAMQKYSLEDGSPMWGDSPVAISAGADLEVSYFGPNPYTKIQQDDEGGYAVAWRVPMSFGALAVYQHVDKNGVTRFPGPIRISHGESSFNPSIPQIAVHGDYTYAVWSVRDRNDTGIFARKIDKEGKSVWSSEPTAIKPIFKYDYEGDFTGYSDINQMSVHDDHINVYFDKIHNFWPTTLNVIKLGFDGTLSGEAEVNGVVDSHSLPQLSRTNTGEDVFSWVDSSWGDGYLYATNMKADGTSGLSDSISLHRTANAFVVNEDNARSITLSYSDAISSEHQVALTSLSDDLTISDVVFGNNTVTATFTPADDTYGELAFELTVTDAADETRSQTSQYRLSVGDVYDAPMINLPETASVSEGGKASISFAISSVESDELDIQWTQSGGPEVSFTTYNNALEFQAPEVNTDTEYSFTVSVNDGVQITQQQVVVTVVKDITPESNSSGSFGWLLTGLAALGLVRRRTAKLSTNKNTNA